jgi:hypothetical protein
MSGRVKGPDRLMMSVGVRPRVVSGLVLTLALVSACSPTTGEDSGPIATYDTGGSDDGFGESLPGQLIMRDDTCVVYEADSGTVSIPVFPDGTEWDSAGASVLLPGRTEPLVLGDRIELGGGHVDEPVDSMRIPVGCPDDLSYYVVAP